MCGYPYENPNDQSLCWMSTSGRLLMQWQPQPTSKTPVRWLIPRDQTDTGYFTVSPSFTTTTSSFYVLLYRFLLILVTTLSDHHLYNLTGPTHTNCFSFLHTKQGDGFPKRNETKRNTTSTQNGSRDTVAVSSSIFLLLGRVFQWRSTVFWLTKFSANRIRNGIRIRIDLSTSMKTCLTSVALSSPALLITRHPRS